MLFENNVFKPLLRVFDVLIENLNEFYYNFLRLEFKKYHIILILYQMVLKKWKMVQHNESITNKFCFFSLIEGPWKGIGCIL